MSAPEKVHPIQFKLFMSGSEWKQSVTSSIDLGFGKPATMDELWDQKLDEAKVSKPSIQHGAGIHEAISEQGYQHNENDPPTIKVGGRFGDRTTDMTQGEGHHRIAAAADIEETTGKHVWIPTNYEERYW